MPSIKTIMNTDFLIDVLLTGGGLSVLLLILMVIFHSIALIFKR